MPYKHMLFALNSLKCLFYATNIALYFYSGLIVNKQNGIDRQIIN